MKLIVFLTLVHKIDARHQLLEDTITVRDDETESYNMAIFLNSCLTPIFLTALMLEMAFFFIYTKVVKQKFTSVSSCLSCHLASINYVYLDASLEANNQRRDRRRGDYEMLHVPGVYTLLWW